MADQFSTASNFSAMPPLSLESLQRTMDELRTKTAPSDWMLIAPDGRVWKGDVKTIFCALAPHHPLLKIGGRNG